MARIASMKIWNVELGLAIHVKAPNGRYIVIDLGATSDVSPLQSLSTEDVGLMVITHPHLDHFSDIDNVSCVRTSVLWRCKNFSEAELLAEARDSDRDKITKYCIFVKAVTEKDKSSTKISIDGLTATVFSSSNFEKSNKNNFSAIVVLQLGNSKIVVCGDNEKPSFSALMRSKDFRNSVKDAAVLVAAHHGRISGYDEDFVNLVSPLITVISDTSKVDTTATVMYSMKSQGFRVFDESSGKCVERKCLTTRKDGNIEIYFGEGSRVGLNYLDIKTHVE